MYGEYEELLNYIGIHKLPKGFTEAYSDYRSRNIPESKELMPHGEYNELLAPYGLSAEKRTYLDETLNAIENDEKLLHFSHFFVWDMCSQRNRYDIDNYTELLPSCIGRYNNAYAFIILLACVPEAKKEMERRGIPYEYYRDIPHRMIREQMPRYIEKGLINVEDMPWKMNFYTLQIFLFDRFLFIPYVFGDAFRLYRSKKTGKVVGIADAGLEIDSEGQMTAPLWPDEGDQDEEGKAPEKDTGYWYNTVKAKRPETFITTVSEDDKEITGCRLNPCGYIENKKVTLSKDEYEIALDKDDWLIAFHIPGGEGYNPERMKNSMQLARDFYKKYYPELPLKGFWSESWLYDRRLSLIIGKGTNISNVRDRLFTYTGGWNGEMLYIHLFKDMDRKLAECEVKTTLARGAKSFLQAGNRFCSTGMIFLYGELESDGAYITREDEDAFDELMKTNGIMPPVL